MKDGLSLPAQGRLFARSLCLQACWSFERMQNLGLTYCLEPWLERCYARRPRERDAALGRHLDYFNTQPYMASFIIGMICALEEEAAALPAEEGRSRLETMERLKKAASAALAGLGDALFWGALRPFGAALAWLAALLLWPFGAAAGAAGAAAAYLGACNAPALLIRWKGIRWGYEWRERLAPRLSEFPWQAAITRLRRGGLLLAAAACALMAAGAPGPGAWASGLGPAGALAAAGYLAAARFWPAALSAPRGYAALCLAGAAATAAGL